jgi:protein SCO1/2
LKGKVVWIDTSAKKVTVDHEAIPGFMGAMAMAYPVKDAQALANLSPGDQVNATLVSGNGLYWLEPIVITKHGSTPVPSQNPSRR